MFRVGRQCHIPNFDVRALFPSAVEAERIRARVAAALALIHDVAPVRYNHLRRDLPKVLVGATHNRGECLFSVGICLLQFDYVTDDKTTPERLALTIVHEGTHARLARAGIEYTEAVRARVERLCISSELVVARRVPAADGLVADVERRLAQPDATWSNEAFQRRGVGALENLGLEGRIGYWIGRALTLFRRGRSQRAA
jgi:hypothetical protein